MSGYYLYGFVPSDTPSPELTGLNGNAVEVVVQSGIGIVTEAVDPAHFQQTLQAHLDDPLWVAEQAVHHERVIGAFLDVGVCPLRFATMVETWEGLEPLLIARAEHVRDTLTRLRGFYEWTLRLWIRRDALDNAVLARPDLNAQQRALDNATGGKAYLLKRKFDQVLEHARTSYLVSLHDQLTADLAASCHDSRSAERRPNDDREHVGVLELVCLLSDDQEAALRDKLNTLATEQGVTNDLSGPFAPYHFVDLDLSEVTS